MQPQDTVGVGTGQARLRDAVSVFAGSKPFERDIRLSIAISVRSRTMTASLTVEELKLVK